MATVRAVAPSYYPLSLSAIRYPPYPSPPRSPWTSARSASARSARDINVLIEIPQGGVPVKYELDKESGALRVDRFLNTAMFYPGNYGFIPHTLSGDGDPVDVIVVVPSPVVAGAIVRVRPVGALLMKDEAGDDEKVIAVPVDKLHPFYAGVECYKDLPDADQPDRALLPALQGPGEGQVGDDRELGRHGPRREDDRRGHPPRRAGG